MRGGILIGLLIVAAAGRMHWSSGTAVSSSTSGVAVGGSAFVGGKSRADRMQLRSSPSERESPAEARCFGLPDLATDSGGVEAVSVSVPSIDFAEALTPAQSLCEVGPAGRRLSLFSQHLRLQI